MKQQSLLLRANRKSPRGCDSHYVGVPSTVGTNGRLLTVNFRRARPTAKIHKKSSNGLAPPHSCRSNASPTAAVVRTTRRAMDTSNIPPIGSVLARKRDGEVRYYTREELQRYLVLFCCTLKIERETLASDARRPRPYSARPVLAGFLFPHRNAPCVRHPCRGRNPPSCSTRPTASNTDVVPNGFLGQPSLTHDPAHPQFR